MVHRVDHRLLDQLLQLLQIENHAGDRIWLALQSHFQNVVMPVAARVGSGPIQLRVLLRRQAPIVRTRAMRRILPGE